MTPLYAPWETLCCLRDTSPPYVLFLLLVQFQLSDKTEQAKSLQESVRSLEAKVEEQSRLITKLEEDILKVHGPGPFFIWFLSNVG